MNWVFPKVPHEFSTQKKNRKFKPCRKNQIQTQNFQSHRERE